MEQLCHKRELQPRSKPQNHPKSPQVSLGVDGGGGEGTPPVPVPAPPSVHLAPSPSCQALPGAGPVFGDVGVLLNDAVLWMLWCLGGDNGDSGDDGDSGAGGCIPSSWPLFPALPQILVLEVLLVVGGSPTPRWLWGRATVCPVLAMSTGVPPSLSETPCPICAGTSPQLGSSSGGAGPPG